MTARFLAFAVLSVGLAAQVSAPVAEHVRQGVLAREQGRLEEARRQLEEAVRGAPELAEAHLYLGLVSHESGDYSAAVESLGRALALKPGLPGARELLGYDLLTLGRAEESIPHLDAARNENTDRWQLSAWLGRAYLESGDSGQALRYLLDAQSSAQGDPELLYLVGKAYSQLALEAHAELLASAPESAYAHLATAEDHDFNGRSEEAIAAYRRALASNDALVGAWRALAGLEQGRGRHRAAVNAYQRALAIQPANETLHLRCGEALLALGLASEALPHLESAVAADSSAPAALEALGKALLDLGRFVEARITLAKALDVSAGAQRRMKLHYQLARISRELGDGEAAREHLREFSVLRDELTAGDQ